VIDGDPYSADNRTSYNSTNVFWRQIRNFIIDTTVVSASTPAVGVHWPTGQATSISNVVFNLNANTGTQHTGLFIEDGSGGFLSDLVFNGGLYGAKIGSQQFSSKNWTFHNCVTAINQLWNWGWIYQQISFKNVTVGLNMSSGGVTNQAVGSVVLFDSEFIDVDIGIIHAHTTNAYPAAAGALILENIDFSNVRVAVQGPNGTDLGGSQSTFNIPAWAQGHAYSPSSANFTEIHGHVNPNLRPPALTSLGRYYTRAKPQYQDWPVSQVFSVRSAGAKGDGMTDDTAALRQAITVAHFSKKILFIDAGDYIVTSTLYVPAGSKIVGEVLPVILATGSFWSNISNPQPVVQVGKVGETGQVEWSDVIVSTKGPAPGAVLIEWNLASYNVPQDLTTPPGYSPPGRYAPALSELPGPSGMWEVHTRIGGFAGSNLQFKDCPAAETENFSIGVPKNCIAAAASVHITKSAQNLYMEANWLWVADHDADDPDLRQLTIYAGRGIIVESTYGVWLVGTAAEHHSLYQYQLVNTQDIFMGHVQTETAYYQPGTRASIPFPVLRALNDPGFPDSCLNGSSFLDPNMVLQANQLSNGCDGWGLRVVNSSGVNVYGASFYSFHYNNNLTCSQQGYGAECQSRIVSLDNGSSDVNIYSLVTVGVQHMVTSSGKDLISAADNPAGFTNLITVLRTVDLE